MVKRCLTADAPSVEREHVMGEIEAHSRAHHPNIIEFHESFEDTVGNAYVVLEHASCGDLADVLRTTRPLGTCSDWKGRRDRREKRY